MSVLCLYTQFDWCRNVSLKADNRHILYVQGYDKSILYKNEVTVTLTLNKNGQISNFVLFGAELFCLKAHTYHILYI